MPSRAARSLWRPALCAVAAVALVEATLPRLMDARLPHGEGRNPRLLRDWDRYVARTAVASPDERRILVLSNSQGRGPEHSPDRIYPSLLARRLETGGDRVRVVNWSVAPSRVPEAVVLLARAQDLAPQVVLAVFPPSWFAAGDYETPGGPTPLSMFESDVTDTAWLYRERLPVEFTRHYLTPATAGTALLARWWPSFRFRDLPAFWLSRRVPRLRPLLPEASRARWYDTDLVRLPRRRPGPAPEFPTPDPHPALVSMLDTAAARLGTRRVFVLQPLWFAIEPRHAPAVTRLKRELAARGWEVWDMSAAVPWTEFLEGSVHLTERGHRLFAELLAARLAEPPPRTP
jgi:hypothetical protein